MLHRVERESVLLVEPDVAERERLEAMLHACGYAVASVADGSAALNTLAFARDCRVVLCDIRLPGMSGFALLDTVTRQHPGVSVIFCTSEQSIAIGVQAFRRGASDVLAKPAGMTALQHSIEGVLLQGKMRRETLSYLRNLEGMVKERTGKLRNIMEDLERSYDVTIEAMGDALDMRDEETEGHSKRVTAYTVALARSMRLTPAELKTIARGAFLHDIGKIAIPDSILLKPGSLTPAEMEIMRGHCEEGYRIVSKIPFLASASEIVLCHQEKFDGSGYPRGLRMQEIPLGARIFAIADTLDAITSDRPYRKGSSFAQALEEIERCSGAQFDPEIVEVFLSMPRATWPTIRTEVGRHSHASELVRSAAA